MNKFKLNLSIVLISLSINFTQQVQAQVPVVSDLNDVIVWSYNENIYSSGTANTATYVNPQYIKRGWFKFGCMPYNVFPDPQHSLWTIPTILNDSGALFEGGVQVSELWKTKGWPCDNPYDPDHSPPYKIPDPVFDDFATRDADDNFFWQPNPWDSITFVSIANENYQDNVLYWAYEQIDANVNALEFDVINGVGNDFTFKGILGNNSNKAYDSYHLGTANFAKKISVVWGHGMLNPVNWFMPTPFASSELGLDSAKYAFDEDATTCWQSDIAANHWIEIDFGRKRRVQQIYLKLYETHILQNFSVKYWDNTLGWQDFSPSINIVNNTEIHKSFLVDPVSTSKIRLFSSDSQVYLPELQIFGCGFRQFLIDKFVNDSGWSATDTRWGTQKLVDFSDINQCPDGTINTFNYQKYLVAHNWTENPFGGQLTQSNIFSPYNPLFLEWLPNAYYRGLGGVFFNDSVILDSITALYLKSYLYQDLHYFWELISDSVRNYAASQGKKIYVTYNGSANDLPFLYSDYLIKGMGRGELFPAYPAPSLTDTTKLHLDGSQVQINPWRLLKKNSLAGRPNNPPVVVFLDYGFGDFPFAHLGGEDEPADERAEYLKSYVWEVYAAGLRFCLPVRTSTLNALYDSTSQGLSLLDVIKHTTDFLNEHKEIYKDTTISSLESLVKVNSIVPYNGDWNIVSGMNNSPVNGSGASIAYINAMDGAKSYLHIINHNWDSINHQMLPQYNVPVSIPVTDSCENLMLISPDFADTVSISFVYEDSSIGFTMPELQYYNVVVLDWGVTSIEETGSITPNKFQLNQNYPNPFNPQTTISYQLPVNGDVALKIYNMLGQEVRTLVNENIPAGYHSVIWNGTDENNQYVTSGIYFYQLKTENDFSETKRMLLLK